MLLTYKFIRGEVVEKDDDILAEEYDDPQSMAVDIYYEAIYEGTDFDLCIYNNRKLVSVFEHFLDFYEDFLPIDFDKSAQYEYADVEEDAFDNYCGIEVMKRGSLIDMITHYLENDVLKKIEESEKPEETKYSGEEMIWQLILEDNSENYYDYYNETYNTITAKNIKTGETKVFTLGLDYYVKYDNYYLKNTETINLCDTNCGILTTLSIRKAYSLNSLNKILDKYCFKENTDFDIPDTYIVDIEKIGIGYRVYFGDQEQLAQSWGDDWNDAPYECNAGTVYPHYVTNYVDIIPPKKFGITPIEVFLGRGSCLNITKEMMKKKIVPAVIILDQVKNDDIPIFFGMGSKEFKDKLFDIKFLK